MSAEKYLRSRQGKVVEAMKVAYMAGKHIIFLITTEPEFVYKIIQSGCIMPCIMGKKDVNGIATETNVRIDKPTAVDGKVDTPMLFVFSSVPKESLELYVRKTERMSAKVFSGDTKDKTIKALENSIILIYTDSRPEVSPTIEPYCEFITVPFMSEMEFKEEVSILISKLDGNELKSKGMYNIIGDEDFLDKLFHSMRAMSLTQIKFSLKKYKNIHGHVYSEDKNELKKLLRYIREYSEKIVSASKALTLIESSSAAPCGMDNLVKWLKDNKSRINSPDKSRAESPATGILIAGVPGTGKSMMAKYVANLLGLSLVRFDFGNVLGSYVGDSEKEMDKTLNTIEALSPCVLWVDEIEKAFSGSTSGHEVTRRLFGKFLTWMQEKENHGVSCFVFATANDVSSLPPEMFRSGRFDEKFYIFMPSAEDCEKIFDSHIKHQNDMREDAVGEDGLPLFDESKVNGRMFAGILDSKNCLKEKLSDEEDKITRKNKFFIGSDIKALIDKAKVKYNEKVAKDNKKNKENYDARVSNLNDSTLENRENAIFNSEIFIETLKETIDEVRTYGETNLKDIAECFVQMARNNFVRAASHEIIPLSGYNDMEGFYNEKELLQSQTEYIKSHEYDQQLYRVVRNVVNNLRKQQIYNRDRYET